MDELKKRMLDIARASRKIGEPRFSRFLDPSELPTAQLAAREAGVSFAAFGGYDEAERKVAGFSADGEIGVGEWPVTCLRLGWNVKYASPGHRDVLGALMGLGVERGTMGDIQMGEGEAFLFALSEVSGYLAANLESAGRAKLTVREVALDEARVAQPKGRQLRVTAPSMRLDAIVAEGYNLSRSDAQALVARGLVKLNHVECLKGDRKVEAGDLVSARGHGRMKVLQEQGETKKGRVGVVLFRYGE